jgi:hypothetical protein
MRWLIRWTDFRTFRDYETIVNADSREEAKAIADERKIPVTYVGPADGEDGQALGASLSCMGQPLRTLHVVSLMLCGMATIGILLQSGGMLASHIWMPF